MLPNSQISLSVLDALKDGVLFMDLERRITYWSRGVEFLTGLKSAEAVGRPCSELLICVNTKGEKDCGADCLLERPFRDGQIQETEFYLRHKEGHRVPVLIRTLPTKDESGRITGAIEILTDNSPVVSLSQQLEDTRRSAMLDSLTGLGNRGFGERFLAAKLAEQKRDLLSFGVLFIDVDHFKTVNDRYGHPVGDRVLKMLAKTMSGGVRSFDVIFRWGGEEFLAIVVGVKEETLRQVGEKLRALMEQSNFWMGPDIVQTTVSLGGTMARQSDTLESLIHRADALMYKSKNEGRNRLTMG